jgi:tetratricopeptide (TPR) repeat protein
MPASRLLLACLAATALAGCVTPATTTTTTPGPQPTAPALAASVGALANDNSSPFGLYLAGRTAADQGHLTAASAYLGRAAEVEGEPMYLKVEAFSAALKAGDVTAAAALAPDGPDAPVGERRLGLLVKGVEALASGDSRGAYALFTSPDMGYPFKNAAMLLAPFAAAGAGDRTNAVARPFSDGDPLTQFVADMDQAQLDERMGARSAAETAYKALLAGGDESGLVRLAYGAFLERRGRQDAAVALYREHLSTSPDDLAFQTALARALKHGRPPPLPDVRQGAAQALLLPAAALMAQRQQLAALDYLRLALRLDPANDSAWVLIGDLLTPADLDAARAAYARVSPASDHYVEARGKLAWTYQNAGDETQALKLARDTAASVPQSRDAAVTLADLLRSDEQFAASVGVLTRVIQASAPSPDWRLYYLRASAYEGEGDNDATEADLAAALKLAPDEPELLNFQAYFWIDRGEHLNEALAMVQRAAAAEPQSGEIADSLGWAYYRLGQYQTAVDKLEQAVLLAPSIPEVNDHLGDAYWRVNRKTEAQFSWRRVLSLDPDDKLKARVEAKLASPAGPDAPLTPPAATSHP